MKLWKTIPFATAILVLQAQAPTTMMTTTSNVRQNPTDSVPLYRVTVVQGSAKAINYRNMKNTTQIDLKGTVLMPQASGVAKVKSDDGKIQITAKVKKMPPASTFGGEFLTYVLWGISTEGRATNLGELVLSKSGKSYIEATEALQTFGLVVTAEPYFAVTQPSNVVVMENVVSPEAMTQVELIDAKYELLKRGQYTLNLSSTEPMIMDDGTPFVVYQARNAVRIARAAGASTYAPEAFGKAEAFLRQAEIDNAKKGKIMMSREAVQRAEDSRLISIKKQDAEQVAMDQRLAQQKLENAKQEAAAATAAQDAALKQTERAETENDSLRSSNEGLRNRNEGLRTKNAGLRTELMSQLNAVLQTRSTARGLIVNMSGVLFQNGKAALLPAAREKLAKIAGILATHKGLKIEADGFTDSNGSDELNQRLSEQRAANTKDYLVSQGVSADSISFKGFGEQNPIASNDTNSGRQENRRVELVVSGEGLMSSEDSGL